MSCPSQMGKRFRVVVLDARPHNEGRALLRHLLEAGLCASYCLLNAAAYIMSEVTKVRTSRHAPTWLNYMLRVGLLMLHHP